VSFVERVLIIEIKYTEWLVCLVRENILDDFWFKLLLIAVYNLRELVDMEAGINKVA